LKQTRLALSLEKDTFELSQTWFQWQLDSGQDRMPEPSADMEIHDEQSETQQSKVQEN
jgi:hypothetical protein